MIDGKTAFDDCGVGCDWVDRGLFRWSRRGCDDRFEDDKSVAADPRREVGECVATITCSSPDGEWSAGSSLRDCSAWSRRNARTAAWS